MFNYDILLIDADDTLFDFRQAEKYALRDTFAEFSLPLDDQTHELYHQINKKLWKEYEKGMYRDKSPWPMRFERLLKAINKSGDGSQMNLAYTKNLGKQPILLDDAEYICSELYKTHKLYIITNGNPSVQHSRFDASPIKDYFSGMFISEEIGSRKPEKAFFDYVLSKINPPDMSKILIIGDSLSSDIAGGINSGIDTCWFNPKHEIAPADLTPTYEIHSLKDIFNIV